MISKSLCVFMSFACRKSWGHFYSVPKERERENAQVCMCLCYVKEGSDEIWNYLIKFRWSMRLNPFHSILFLFFLNEIINERKINKFISTHHRLIHLSNETNDRIELELQLINSTKSFAFTKFHIVLLIQSKFLFKSFKNCAMCVNKVSVNIISEEMK